MSALGTPSGLPGWRLYAAGREGPHAEVEGQLSARRAVGLVAAAAHLALEVGDEAAGFSASGAEGFDAAHAAVDYADDDDSHHTRRKDVGGDCSAM